MKLATRQGKENKGPSNKLFTDNIHTFVVQAINTVTDSLRTQKQENITTSATDV